MSAELGALVMTECDGIMLWSSGSRMYNVAHLVVVHCGVFYYAGLVRRLPFERASGEGRGREGGGGGGGAEHRPRRAVPSLRAASGHGAQRHQAIVQRSTPGNPFAAFEGTR